MKRKTLAMIAAVVLFVAGVNTGIAGRFPVNPHEAAAQIVQGETPVALPGTPQATPGASPSASPVDANPAECRAIPDYYDALNTVVGKYSTVFDFLTSDDDFDDLSDADANAFIDEGTQMVGDIRALDVPAPYVDGNEGIALLIENLVDLMTFYHVDSSVVPDLGQQDTALSMIYQAEADTAAACPAEIEDIGGYIFLDPSNQ